MDGILNGFTNTVDLTTILAGYEFKTDLTTTLLSYYTKTQVDNKFADLIGTAPANLNSLQELAASLGNDANLSSTIFTALSTKLSTANFNTAIADYALSSSLSG